MNQVLEGAYRESRAPPDRLSLGWCELPLLSPTYSPAEACFIAVANRKAFFLYMGPNFKRNVAHGLIVSAIVCEWAAQHLAHHLSSHG
jgi:hypothetical protein